MITIFDIWYKSANRFHKMFSLSPVVLILWILAIIIVTVKQLFDGSLVVIIKYLFYV